MANTPAHACPLAKKCGGCQLQNLSYDEQLHLKQATAIRLLGRFGHVEEIIGMGRSSQACTNQPHTGLCRSATA